MTMDGGPLSPEALAAQQAYWSNGAVSSASTTPPLMTPPAAPELTSYYGPPAPPAPSPAPVVSSTPPSTAAVPYDKVDTSAYFGPTPTPAASGWSGPDPVAAFEAGTEGGTPGIRQPVSQVRGDPKAVTQAAPARPSGGGGPSGPSAFDKVSNHLMGTYDDEKAALQAGANAEKDRGALMSEGAAEIAQRKMEDQAIAQTEAANAKQHFEDYSAETQRQLDDVKSMKIQPNRAYADTGSAVAAVIGGILGGVYQGLNKLQSNPFIDQMNKVIERDIDAQKHDIATKKGAVAERKGMLADMRATYKDEALAKAQAKNLYYEGAKEQLAAEAATYDSPAIQARADQAITALTRAQDELKLKKLMQEAAARNAAAGAAEHRRQIDFENQLKLQDMKNKTVTAEAGASKDLRAGNEKTDEQTAHLGTELSKPDIIEAKKTIEDLKRKLVNPNTGEVDGSRSIPGVGPGADARESLASRPKGVGTINPAAWAAYGVAGLDSEERVGRMEWNRLGLAYKHAVTGAGGSDKEAEGIQSAFAGASTPAEQAAAIRLADAAMAERESRIRAGAPRAAVEKYDARLSEERDGRPQPVRREPVGK